MRNWGGSKLLGLHVTDSLELFEELKFQNFNRDASTHTTIRGFILVHFILIHYWNSKRQNKCLNRTA